MDDNTDVDRFSSGEPSRRAFLRMLSAADANTDPTKVK